MTQNRTFDHKAPCQRHTGSSAAMGQALQRFLALNVVIPFKTMGTLSPLEGRATVPGLRGEVRIHRDAQGVPHIFAAHEEDLYFAQGAHRT